MRYLSFLLLLLIVSISSATDLTQVPANTWVELKFTTDQPGNDPLEKGQFGPQGWNKIVYDSDGKRVLYYDRWIDKKHGGWTIYGNCLFALDPAVGKLTPVKIDNWCKMEPKGGGYRTFALPANDTEPTPASRHVYHAFEYVSDLKSVFICNGANQTVIDKDGKLIGHDACDGAWRLDLKTNKWSPIPSNCGRPTISTTPWPIAQTSNRSFTSRDRTGRSGSSTGYRGISQGEAVASVSRGLRPDDRLRPNGAANADRGGRTAGGSVQSAEVAGLSRASCLRSKDRDGEEARRLSNGSLRRPSRLRFETRAVCDCCELRQGQSAVGNLCLRSEEGCVVDNQVDQPGPVVQELVLLGPVMLRFASGLLYRKGER